MEGECWTKRAEGKAVGACRPFSARVTQRDGMDAGKDGKVVGGSGGPRRFLSEIEIDAFLRGSRGVRGKKYISTMR